MYHWTIIAIITIFLSVALTQCFSLQYLSERLLDWQMKSGCWWELGRKIGIVKQICSSVQSSVSFACSSSVSLWHFPNLSWWTLILILACTEIQVHSIVNMLWSQRSCLCGDDTISFLIWSCSCTLKRCFTAGKSCFSEPRWEFSTFYFCLSVNKYKVSWIAVPMKQ